MEINEWKKCVLKAVKDIADANFQKRDRYVSSPEEMYCMLFDDFMFKEFLELKSSGLNLEQITLGHNLACKLEEYSYVIDRLDPEEISADPKWHNIQVCAKKFLASCL